jgi:Xaa-Pro aminopeptidase
MSTAKLIVDDSERNANLYYATRFLAPDAFIYIKLADRSLLVMSDLEVDRARSQAKVTEVLSYAKVAGQVKQRLNKDAGMMDVIDEVLRANGVKTIEVERTFGVGYADRLRALGYSVEPKPEPFFPERVIKSPEEVAWIEQTQRATEAAVEQAIELLRNSEVKADGTLWIGGKPLTVELLRKVIHVHLMEQDCVGQHTIVAPGLQAVDPHNEGSGPLRAHEPIVMDVFPQHAQTRYYADMTRTVVKGKAPDKIRRMFEAVREGQEIAYRMIKDGADGEPIHRAIDDYFVSLGFTTGEQGGRMQGFFHGTGHGVGIEIHEAPRISRLPDVLREGMVVTVEPGLYYADAGGMRIEDMVLVTKTGCRNLTKMPRVLEV